jgi:glycosyltransferase involved in cell wall biosynthesis
VDRDSTGLFCDVRSATSLAAALLRFIAMPQARRRELGRLGRTKVEREFDERLVLRTYVNLAVQIDGEKSAARKGSLGRAA